MDTPTIHLTSQVLGAMMGLCQLKVVAFSPVLQSSFEIAMAFLISFASRAIASSGLFCFETMTSAGIIMILPGYIICTATVEIAVSALAP